MNCKRCGKELPVGQTKICPHCGIYLEAIIKPRGSADTSKKPMSRATVMSFLSIALVIGMCLVLIPVLRGMNKTKALENIEEMFQEWNGREAEFSETDWEKNLAVFSKAVATYKDDHPKDEENNYINQRYLYILCGLDPDYLDEYRPIDPDKEQRKYNEDLIKRTKREIIDIGATLSSPNSAGKRALNIRIRNESTLTISEVRMGFGAVDEFGTLLPEFMKDFDAAGNLIEGFDENTSQWIKRTNKLIATGKEEGFYYEIDTNN